jgi:tetratricopeptide (TPR) repeat protein
MKRIVLFVLMFVKLSYASLEQAEANYANQNYASALAQYQALLQDFPSQGDLLYNIGNCYFKLEQYGYAIVYYRKALKWSSFDSDSRYNLNLARQFVVDETQTKSFLVSFIKWRDALSLNQLAYSFCVLICVLITLLWLKRVGYKRELLANLSWVVTVCMLFIGTWFMFSFVAFRSDYAVAVTKKIEVHSGPSESLPILFYIHEGHELRIITKKLQWCEIELSNGFKGWVKQSTVVEI